MSEIYLFSTSLASIYNGYLNAKRLCILMARFNVTEPTPLSLFSLTFAGVIMGFINHVISQIISGYKILLLVFRAVDDTST